MKGRDSLRRSGHFQGIEIAYIFLESQFLPKIQVHYHPELMPNSANTGQYILYPHCPFCVRSLSTISKRESDAGGQFDTSRILQDNPRADLGYMGEYRVTWLQLCPDVCVQKWWTWVLFLLQGSEISDNISLKMVVKFAAPLNMGKTLC